MVSGNNRLCKERSASRLREEVRPTSIWEVLVLAVESC